MGSAHPWWPALFAVFTLITTRSIYHQESLRPTAQIPLRLLAATVFAALCVAAKPASAHGFGQRYELPLPFQLYLGAAAAAIVVSFLIVGLLLRRAPPERSYPRINLSGGALGRVIAGLGLVLKLVALGLFVVAILAGFFGDQNPYRNIAPTLVWIIGWVGLALVSALVGEVWRLINPWQTLFDGADALYRRLGARVELAHNRPYPKALGVWPAFLLLLAFCWTELVYPNASVPAHLAGLALAYSALTFAGMLAFGPATWLRHGEVFSVVFGLFARFAPTAIHRVGPQHFELELRPYGAGLLDGEPASPSMTAFVLLMLSTVLYDGMLGTPEWTNMEGALAAFLAGGGAHGPLLIRTAGLLAFWVVFFGAYMAANMLMSRAVAGRQSTPELARSFAFTLIPIAIGYHVAHYLVFLLVQGQYVIPLLSDPFGYGWNLFGTAGYRPDVGTVGARFAWTTAVAAVVLGHIAAVYLAHVRAIQRIPVRGLALPLQVPLTALMVGYTIVSLSILAEPMVERRTAAQSSATSHTVAIPADALLPELGSGRLQPVGADKSAKVKLTYRMLGSAFHDGSRTNIADLLYSYVFAYRWGKRDDNPHYDPTVDAATAPMRRHLAGLRIVGSDTTSKTYRVGDASFVRELLVVEVYATAVLDDPERDAIVVPPWSTLPWHLIVLMEEAVTRGWAAFSQAEATRRGVEWLDLVRSAETKKNMAALIADFERSGHRPDSLRSHVSEDEARRRWAALAAFHEKHGHFLVTNGPYQLKSWLADKVTLDAFRDLSYPLGVGSYDAYANPRRGFVTHVEWQGDRATLSGDIEVLEKFQRSHRLVRTPLRSLPPEVAKRAAPECRYTIVDDTDRVVLAGHVPLGEGSMFHIDLAGRVPAGRYIMFAVIAPAGNVMNADIRRVPVVIASER